MSPGPAPRRLKAWLRWAPFARRPPPSYRFLPPQSPAISFPRSASSVSCSAWLSVTGAAPRWRHGGRRLVDQAFSGLVSTISLPRRSLGSGRRTTSPARSSRSSRSVAAGGNHRGFIELGRRKHVGRARRRRVARTSNSPACSPAWAKSGFMCSRMTRSAASFSGRKPPSGGCANRGAPGPIVRRRGRRGPSRFISISSLLTSRDIVYTHSMAR